MTFGGFLLGALMMIIGFFMVRNTDAFLRWFGDLGSAFGVLGARWLSWKMAGVILLVAGFLVAFGLWQLFISLTIGRFFSAPSF